MKTNRLFEDVFMDIDWSLYDDETVDLSGVGDKIYRTANNAAAKWHPKTREELIKAIEEELGNGNTDLNCIDTSEITDMSQLFDQGFYGIYLSEEQQKTLDVSEWDVSNVKDMYSMFYHCKNFNQDLSKWDVRNVRNVWSMFCGCTDFNQDLSKWDVRNVENINNMFRGCTKFNQDLSKWDVRNVKEMTSMFSGCTDFNQDLSGWDVRNVKNMWGMFQGCLKLKENGLIPDWYKHKLK